MSILNVLEKQVDKLAKKMQQQAATMRRSQPEIPLTQRWSPDCSPDTSPRSDRGEAHANDESLDDGFDEDEHVLNKVIDHEIIAKHTAANEIIAKHTDIVNTGETNKENTPLVNMAAPAPRPAHSVCLNAADEVSCRSPPPPAAPRHVLFVWNICLRCC